MTRGDQGKGKGAGKPGPRKGGTKSRTGIKGGKADPKPVSSSVSAFKALVETYRYPMGSMLSTALTSFTFFAGAGLSKSWRPEAPVGQQLFQLGDLVDEAIGTEMMMRVFGIEPGAVGPEQVRQIIYQLDMYERYPDVRSRYVDDDNTAMMRAALRAAVVRRYEDLCGIDYFDGGMGKFPLPSPTKAQSSLLSFFGHLHRCLDGSKGFAEGIRTNFVTTNYDFVIETILDHVVDEDDSLFLYTYRGFTPERISEHENPKPTVGHWDGTHLLKLNGGFEIHRSGGGYRLNYDRRSAGDMRRDPPILMLPSREQDYSDPYFKAIFPKAVRLMRDTQVLVIVGYSMPEDDALMRFVVRQFAEEPEDGRGKVIVYVDPGLTAVEMRDKVAAVFPSVAEFDLPHLLPYPGSFVDFVDEYLKLVDPRDLEP